VATGGCDGWDANEALAEQFEEHRIRLRAVAYRMLGSLSEADDAVQEAWLRLSGAEAKDVENLGGWLTTVVARVCLNILRSRRTRPEVPLDPHVPDPVVSPEAGVEPEDEALLAVLDPELVLRSDHGTLPGSAVVRGPQAVAAQALLFADPSRIVHPALVNGAAGVVIRVDGKSVLIVGFTVVNDRIIAVDALADPERIGWLDLGFLDDRAG
jgi:hypothetical protein